jgi:hypothetical protein
MNTKLSFFSRAVAVAGVLALSLPAFAQSNPPAATPAPAISPAPAADKGAVKQRSTEHKAMKTTKDKKAAKKPLVKTAKNVDRHKAVKPASTMTTNKTEQPATGGAAK